MLSKKATKSLHTIMIVIIIVALAAPLIVYSASGGSSSGGCCGGCCSSSDVEDTQGDGTETAEDAVPTPAPAPGPTICEQKKISITKVNGTFKQTILSNHYEYTYSYTITACKEGLTCKVSFDGLKTSSPEGTFSVPMNSTTSRSGTYSSEQVEGFETKDVFNQMTIEVSDKSVGNCGAGKFCYPER
ncbi:MAG: hypothetical protein V1837_00790 [Candidatus Woesearchaeota archaeon]